MVRKVWGEYKVPSPVPIPAATFLDSGVAEVMQGVEPSKRCHPADLSFAGYIVTQPALDDVPEGFYPSPETENEVQYTI